MRKSDLFHVVWYITHPFVPAVPERRDPDVKTNPECKSANEDSWDEHAYTEKTFMSSWYAQITAMPTVTLYEGVVEGVGKLE